MSGMRKGSFSRIFKKEKSSQAPETFIISGPKNFREGVHVTFDPDSQNFKVFEFCNFILFHITKSSRLNLFIFFYLTIHFLFSFVINRP
jgi:hypothetical protein